MRTRTWLLNCGIDIPPGATAVHGITTEQARGLAMSLIAMANAADAADATAGEGEP